MTGARSEDAWPLGVHYPTRAARIKFAFCCLFSSSTRSQITVFGTPGTPGVDGAPPTNGGPGGFAGAAAGPNNDSTRIRRQRGDLDNSNRRLPDRLGSDSTRDRARAGLAIS